MTGRNFVRREIEQSKPAPSRDSAFCPPKRTAPGCDPGHTVLGTAHSVGRTALMNSLPSFPTGGSDSPVQQGTSAPLLSAPTLGDRVPAVRGTERRPTSDDGYTMSRLVDSGVGVA